MNGKKSTVIAAAILTAAAMCSLSFASCGKKGDTDLGNNGGNGDTNADNSLKYTVQRDELEGITTTSAVSEKPDVIQNSYDSYSYPDSQESSEDAPDSEEEPAVSDTSDAAEVGGGSDGVKTDANAPTVLPSYDIEVFGDKNVGDDMPLQNVTINGVSVNIRDDNVDSLLSKTGTKQNKSKIQYNYANDDVMGYDGIFFYGYGYGIDSGTKDPEYRYTGTHFFIEGQRGGNELAMQVKIGTDLPYGIRAIYSSTASTKDFDVEYINGVKCGMDRASVEGRIGKGSQSKKYTYYANNNNVLFLAYSGDTVTEIYLVNDYSGLPIKYSPSEDPDSKADESSESPKETEPVETVTELKPIGEIVPKPE